MAANSRSSDELVSASLEGELRGIVAMMRDFKSEPLFPMFEAVVNSIQAIDERFRENASREGKIEIEIIRERQFQPEFDGWSAKKELPIVSFRIIDNGIGFNDANLKSFRTIASTYKVEKGCKGMGRFSWLKVFDIVRIESVYSENERRYKRNIEFSLENGLKVSDPKEVTRDVRTTVDLIKMKKSYRDSQSTLKTTRKIAQRTLEHILSYFLREVSPTIIVKDEDSLDEQEISLRQIYDSWSDQIKSEPITIGGENFTLYHLKLYDTIATMHQLVLCANYRDVESRQIGKLLGTSVQFDENDKRFVYAAYIYGDYLDRHVNLSRTSFDLPATSGLYDKDTPVGLDTIVADVVRAAKAYLQVYIERVGKRKLEKVMNYVSKKNPALRAAVKYCPEAMDDIDVDDDESKIDEVLYGYKGRAEFKMRAKGEALLKKRDVDNDKAESRAQELAIQMDDFQKDSLAEYVLFRRIIIDLFKQRISAANDGGVEKEAVVHDIFFPRRLESGAVDYDKHNLWLLDDRLAFHSEAASDLPIGKHRKKGEEDRPDILLFSEVSPDSAIARSVSIIEFKRPLRRNYEESPISQMLRMVRDVRAQGGRKFVNGRELRVREDYTQFYCYGLFDMTDPIRRFASDSDYAMLPDGLGYYNFHKGAKASVYLIDYDKIVEDARKRNYAFFKSLGIDTFPMETRCDIDVK